MSTVSPSYFYAIKILEKWGELMDLSEEFRKNLLLGVIEQETSMEYISKLNRLWLELYPNVRGRTDIDTSIVKKFEEFKKYYQDPTLLKDPGEAENLFAFEELIRLAIEELGLTSLGGIE